MVALGKNPMYKFFIRPILFLFPPETVHHIVSFVLKYSFKVPGIKKLVKKSYSYSHPSLERTVFGLKFPNPVGLAAGFDKNADLFNELDSFGFSFIEIGTVTPKPQQGNPKPRCFRLTLDEALINRMGFNNKGVSYAKKKLLLRRSKVIIGGNIGKNTLTPNESAINDYTHCFLELYPVVDYFVVNVSCPNIANLKELQDRDYLFRILTSLVNLRSKQKEYKPILIKVSPDLLDHQLEDTIDVAMELAIDGFVATNTTTSRENLKTPLSMVEQIGNGGLSGKPIAKRSTELIKKIASRTNGKMPIIGVGGIMNPEDTIEKLNAGASLVQVYTGFIYSGPSIAKSICKSIIAKDHHQK